MKKEFNFTWAALNLLGKSLYSNAWAAISELVANGLDAKAGSARTLAHFGLRPSLWR